MHWKLKAATQKAVALLPSSTSYRAYYWLQRNFGGWRNLDPSWALIAGIEAWDRIVQRDRNPADAIFLEVGTGRVPLTPLAFWLMGARKVFTVDLNPYLKCELLQEALQYIARHRDEVEGQFRGFLDRARFDRLISYIEADRFSLSSFLEMCCIEYRAPADAANTGLPDGCIDFHTSFTVLEHVPRSVLGCILKEGMRILKDSGLMVHRIDYSDHFSHTDLSISAINFLRYSDSRWHFYAGNRYMYMNRLRHDDYIAIFSDLPHEMLEADPEVDKNVRKLLEAGALPLNERFRGKSIDTLSTVASWIVCAKGVAAVVPGSGLGGARQL